MLSLIEAEAFDLATNDLHYYVPFGSPTDLTAMYHVLLIWHLLLGRLVAKASSLDGVVIELDFLAFLLHISLDQSFDGRRRIAPSGQPTGNLPDVPAPAHAQHAFASSCCPRVADLPLTVDISVPPPGRLSHRPGGCPAAYIGGFFLGQTGRILVWRRGKHGGRLLSRRVPSVPRA